MPARRNATRPLNLGIVGCGFVTRTRHLPALRRVPEVRVVAVADVDPAAARDVADRWGIPRRHADGRDLVADPAVEAVAVCVPAACHVEVALAALEAGKHVLVEKPLALSLEEADRLLERASRSRPKTLFGFNLRWHRLVRTAREMIRAGRIGTIQSVCTTYSDAVLGRPGLPAWRARRALGGGALLEKAVHHVDLWRFLLDDEVAEVFGFTCAGRGEDQTAVITARMRKGALATALVMDASAVRNELALYGDAGGLGIDCYRSDGLAVAPTVGAPGAPRVRLRRIASSIVQIATHLGDIRRGGVFDASYEAEWRHFVDVIRRDAPPGCTLEDGRRALEVVLAAMQSDASGAPVRLDGRGAR